MAQANLPRSVKEKLNDIKLKSSLGILMDPFDLFKRLGNISIPNPNYKQMVLDQYDIARQRRNWKWIEEARHLTGVSRPFLGDWAQTTLAIPDIMQGKTLKTNETPLDNREKRYSDGQEKTDAYSLHAVDRISSMYSVPHGRDSDRYDRTSTMFDSSQNSRPETSIMKGKSIISPARDSRMKDKDSTMLDSSGSSRYTNFRNQTSSSISQARDGERNYQSSTVFDRSQRSTSTNSKTQITSLFSKTEIPSLFPNTSSRDTDRYDQQSTRLNLSQRSLSTGFGRQDTFNQQNVEDLANFQQGSQISGLSSAWESGSRESAVHDPSQRSRPLNHEEQGLFHQQSFRIRPNFEQMSNLNSGKQSNKSDMQLESINTNDKSPQFQAGQRLAWGQGVRHLEHQAKSNVYSQNYGPNYAGPLFSIEDKGHEMMPRSQVDIGNRSRDSLAEDHYHEIPPMSSSESERLHGTDQQPDTSYMSFGQSGSNKFLPRKHRDTSGMSMAHTSSGKTYRDPNTFNRLTSDFRQGNNGGFNVDKRYNDDNNAESDSLFKDRSQHYVMYDRQIRLAQNFPEDYQDDRQSGDTHYNEQYYSNDKRGDNRSSYSIDNLKDYSRSGAMALPNEDYYVSDNQRAFKGKSRETIPLTSDRQVTRPAKFPARPLNKRPIEERNRDDFVVEVPRKKARAEKQSKSRQQVSLLQPDPSSDDFYIDWAELSDNDDAPNSPPERHHSDSYRFDSLSRHHKKNSLGKKISQNMLFIQKNKSLDNDNQDGYHNQEHSMVIVEELDGVMNEQAYDEGYKYGMNRGFHDNSRDQVNQRNLHNTAKVDMDNFNLNTGDLHSANGPMKMIAMPLMNIVQPVGQPMIQPIGQPIIQPMGQPIIQPMDQTMIQPMRQHMIQPMEQPMIQHVGQPFVPAYNMNVEQVDIVRTNMYRDDNHWKTPNAIQTSISRERYNISRQEISKQRVGPLNNRSRSSVPGNKYENRDDKMKITPRSRSDIRHPVTGNKSKTSTSSKSDIQHFSHPDKRKNANNSPQKVRKPRRNRNAAYLERHRPGYLQSLKRQMDLKLGQENKNTGAEKGLKPSLDSVNKINPPSSGMSTKNNFPKSAEVAKAKCSDVVKNEGAAKKTESPKPVSDKKSKNVSSNDSVVSGKRLASESVAKDEVNTGTKNPNKQVKYKEKVSCVLCGFNSIKPKQHMNKHLPTILHNWFIVQAKDTLSKETTRIYVKCLEYLKDLILGSDKKELSELCKLLDDQKLVLGKSKGTNISVSPIHEEFMQKLCKYENWEVQKRFTIKPINSNASLIDWRVLEACLTLMNEKEQALFVNYCNDIAEDVIKAAPSQFKPKKNKNKKKKKRSKKKKTADNGTANTPTSQASNKQNGQTSNKHTGEHQSKQGNQFTNKQTKQQANNVTSQKPTDIVKRTGTNVATNFQPVHSNKDNVHFLDAGTNMKTEFLTPGKNTSCVSKKTESIHTQQQDIKSKPKTELVTPSKNTPVSKTKTELVTPSKNTPVSKTNSDILTPETNPNKEKLCTSPLVVKVETGSKSAQPVHKETSINVVSKTEDKASKSTSETSGKTSKEIVTKTTENKRKPLNDSKKMPQVVVQVDLKTEQEKIEKPKTGSMIPDTSRHRQANSFKKALEYAHPVKEAKETSNTLNTNRSSSQNTPLGGLEIFNAKNDKGPIIQEKNDGASNEKGGMDDAKTIHDSSDNGRKNTKVVVDLEPVINKNDVGKDSTKLDNTILKKTTDIAPVNLEVPFEFTATKEDNSAKNDPDCFIVEEASAVNVRKETKTLSNEVGSEKQSKQSEMGNKSDPDKGESKLCEIDFTVESIKAVTKLTSYSDPNKYPTDLKSDTNMKYSIGVKPRFAASLTEEKLEQFEKLLSHKATVALGEVGLDFTEPEIAWQCQEQVLKQVLEYCSPRKVIVLCLEEVSKSDFNPYYKLLEIVEEFCGSSQPILLQEFSGNSSVVQAWISKFRKCYFGFSANGVTLSSSQVLALKSVPKDRFILQFQETGVSEMESGATTEIVQADVLKIDENQAGPSKGLGKGSCEADAINKAEIATCVQAVTEVVATVFEVSVKDVLKLNQENRCRLYGTQI